MHTTTVTLLFFSAFISLLLLAYWLDAKYQWRLISWLTNGQGNPFIKTANKGQEATKDQHQTDQQLIKSLQERIETLEAIVTEPSYELKKEINALQN
jgi:hypothetical protein